MKRRMARAKVTRWAATAATGTISVMNCRPGCAACCTAPSISSPLPGYPEGKPAGVPCPFLDEALRCTLFGLPERPRVCSSLQPDPDMCGDSREQAMRWLTKLEIDTGLDAEGSDWPRR